MCKRCCHHSIFCTLFWRLAWPGREMEQIGVAGADQPGWPEQARTGGAAGGGAVTPAGSVGPGQEGEPEQARTGLAAAGRDVTPLGSEPCTAYQARSVVRAWVWAVADAVPDS